MILPEGVVYLPGRFLQNPGPLQRYLPPLPAEVGSAWLAQRLNQGGWVLDPFGASPHLLVEIARSGYRVLAAVNNPIARFLIELYADPPSEADLRAALADLAATQKSGERIEPQIRALYNTNCAQCGRLIEAQAFVWERDGTSPVGRIYSCPYCKDSGEQPLSQTDADMVARTGTGGLHHSRALERVAAISDPDRAYAEEALAVYPRRSVYALFNLINHLDMLPTARQRAASALLLSAFDQTNGLWHYPAVRFRPRQLSLPQRYLERNTWLALEQSIGSWSSAFSETNPESEALPLAVWPELPEKAGSICLYEGRLKDLASQLRQNQAADIQIGAVVAALPRPNQAFWTLSALWAGWLWGQTATASFKSVLRRRRYDWNWHVIALSSAFESLAPLIEPGTPFFGLIGEAEPGFLSAALLAGEISGFDLVGTALRSGQDQAQIHWKMGSLLRHPEVEEKIRLSLTDKHMQEYLKALGEPASFLKMHTASLEALLHSHALPSSENTPPAEILRLAETSIETEMERSRMLIRLGGSSRSLEVGQWWLDEKAIQDAKISESLADRLEMAVVRLLQTRSGIELREMDLVLCQEFPGPLTPDLELVQEVLDSYGVLDPPGSENWRLRDQDQPGARRVDLQEMHDLLVSLGPRLGFQTNLIPTGAGLRPALLWSGADGRPLYQFHITASALVGRIVFGEAAAVELPAGLPQRLIVLPGGRAGLVEFKLRRDSRLRKCVEESWKFIKFRHVRWLAENTSLRMDNFDQALTLDPLTNRDPQMLLL